MEDYQCLLFISPKITLKNSKEICQHPEQNTVQGFCLLPSSAIKNCPQMLQLFACNNIEVLNNQFCQFFQCALEYDKVEIISITIRDYGPANVQPPKTPYYFRVSVEPCNNKIVRQLLGRYAAICAHDSYDSAAVKVADEESSVILERILAIKVDIQFRNRHAGTLLHLAVTYDDETLVALLLKHNACVDAETSTSSTPLHLAAESGNLNIIKLLLEHKAKVNAEMEESSTPLHLAAKYGHLTAVNLLLENGANINARRKDGATSLLLATEERHLEIVSLLLKNGADVNVGNHDGLTPLHIAAKENFVDIVNKVLERGAIVNARMTYCHAEGITPLCLAIEGGSLLIVERLLKCGADLNCLRYDGRTFLRLAVEEGLAEIVKHLLKHGADVNESSYNEQTILKLAVERGNLEIIKCVLEHHPDRHNKINKRVLYEMVCAVGEKADKIVRMLLQHGFTTGAECINDSKIVHNAICKNYYKIVEQLLDHGTDVNLLYRYYDPDYKSNNFFRTKPLFTAIKFSEEGIIELLVKRGADVNADLFFDCDSTPVEKAIECNNPKALKILLANKAEFPCDSCYESEAILSFAIEHKSLELVEDLLKRGIDVNGSGRVPIVDAAGKSSLEVVQLLAKYGASVDSRTLEGFTALHSATSGDGDRLDIVKFLIQNNADLEAKCFWKNATPMFNAVSKRRLRMVDELLKLGVTIDGRDKEGGSPLHYAVVEGGRKIFRALLDFNFMNTGLIRKTDICRMFSVPHLQNLADHHCLGLYHLGSARLIRIRKCADILVSHILKTKAVFLDCCSEAQSCEIHLTASDDESLLASLENEKNLLPVWYLFESDREEFLNDCKAEIAQLKTQYVSSSSVSFYDILTKDVKQLSCYLRNASIVQTLNSKYYKTKFPIYASVIFYQIRKGKQRRSLLNRTIKLFHLLCRHFNRLSRDLKEEVLNYLSNKELEVLIYTCIQTDV